MTPDFAQCLAETVAWCSRRASAEREELTRLGIPVAPVGPDLAGGRLLFTTINTDSCEAATAPSNGYYDLDDLPGWDTWVFHARTDERWGAIYCWVPAHLVELARAGMDVIPVMSVEWADSLDVQPAVPPEGLACLLNLNSRLLTVRSDSVIMRCDHGTGEQARFLSMVNASSLTEKSGRSLHLPPR